MRISVEDIEFVNWEKVREKIKEEAIAKIVSVCEIAANDIKHLKPGQKKIFPITIGKIVVSRPKEETT